MAWTIHTRDKISLRIVSKEYSNEADFLAALRDVPRDHRKRFISATMPNGLALDKVAAKALASVGAAVPPAPLAHLTST